METISGQFSLLAETYRRLLHIIQSDDPDRKKDLVAARRNLSTQLGWLENAVKTRREGLIDASLAREFGMCLSHVRTCIAHHQAEWPAVRIDENAEDFRAASGKTAGTVREFLEWGARSFGANVGVLTPPVPGSPTEVRKTG